MTFSNTAWAINGPLTPASLARRAEFAAAGGNRGVVSVDDLKVTALSTPGQGIQISSGTGLIPNYYQGSVPKEMYVVSNDGTHTVAASDMPSSSTSDRWFVVGIVIGDPDYSQSGHPWMPSGGVPAGEEDTFQYVRPTLVQVANTSFLDALKDSFGITGGYPVLPLALIHIPANTTTVQQSDIIDLRRLANPRTTGQVKTSAPLSSQFIHSGTGFENWPVAGYPLIYVPIWATRVTAVIMATGVAHTGGNVTGYVQALFANTTGEAIKFDAGSSTDADRQTLVATLDKPIEAARRGTSQACTLQAYKTPSDPGTLALDAASLVTYIVNFYEE